MDKRRPDNSIELMFINPQHNSRVQVLCPQNILLCKIVDKLITNSFISQPQNGYSWRCTCRGRALNQYCTLSDLNLEENDCIYLYLKKEPENPKNFPMVTLYGCPSSKDVKGIVPDCMLVCFEDFQIVER